MPKSSLHDLATLLYTKDLTELVQVASAIDPHLGVWLLLHPQVESRQILLAGGQTHRLDPLAAARVTLCQYPWTDSPVRADFPWVKNLLGYLAYQLEFIKDTSFVTSVQSAGSCKAIVGITGESPLAADLAYAVGLAVRQKQEIEQVRRDVQGYRHLLQNHGKSLILATRDGRIMAATEGGSVVLKRLSGPKADPDGMLPVALSRALKDRFEHLVLDDLKVWITDLPAQMNFLNDSLVSFLFCGATKPGPQAQGIPKLTAAERRVYERILAGDRNKEIADRLGISKHTVKHHASAVLRKLGCADRLLLLAQARKSGEETTLTLEPVTALPVMSGLPELKPVLVGKRRRTRSFLDG